MVAKVFDHVVKGTAGVAGVHVGQGLFDGPDAVLELVR